jgi:hypothetical protein
MVPIVAAVSVTGANTRPFSFIGALRHSPVAQASLLFSLPSKTSPVLSQGSHLLKKEAILFAWILRRVNVVK